MHLLYVNHTSIKTKNIGENVIRALPLIAAPNASEDVV